MKEITRIHIAKISYDIEVSARKNLEKYMASLEVYAAEADVYNDIEIRVTELLAERGITKDGVISDDDVRSVREQLGEPEAFADMDGDIVTGPATQGEQRRRLYRNLDQAVLGGVLSGVAAALRIDVIWVRLVFIVLLIASFGTAALVYIVLWIALPSATTAAEKLQLAGKPVTLASLRMQGEIDAKTGDNTTMRLVRRVLTTLLGAGAAFGATIAFVITVWGAVGLLWGTSENSPLSQFIPGDSAPMWIAYGLFVASGLLLTLFLSVIAYVFLARTWTKKIGLILLSVAVAGCVAFGTGLGSAFLSSMQYQQRIEASVRTHEVSLESFDDVRTLHVVGEEGLYANVLYVVTDGAPRYTIATVPGMVKASLTVADNKASAKLTLRSGSADIATPYTAPAVITVYGPALDELSARDSSVTYETTSSQQHLKATAFANASLDIEGTYETLDARTELQGSVTATIAAEDATITRLVASTDGGDITAGVVRTLTVAQRDVCPAVTSDSQNRVTVENVSSGTMTYNEAEKVATSQKTPCGTIQIGDNE